MKDGKLRLVDAPSEVREFFKQCGAKGGSSTSDKKAASSRKNGFVPCKPGKARGRPKQKPE